MPALCPGSANRNKCSPHGSPAGCLLLPSSHSQDACGLILCTSRPSLLRRWEGGPLTQRRGSHTSGDGVLTTILHSPPCDPAALTTHRVGARSHSSWPLPVFDSALLPQQHHSLPGPGGPGGSEWMDKGHMSLAPAVPVLFPHKGRPGPPLTSPRGFRGSNTRVPPGNWIPLS